MLNKKEKRNRTTYIGALHDGDGRELPILEVDLGGIRHNLPLIHDGCLETEIHFLLRLACFDCHVRRQLGQRVTYLVYYGILGKILNNRYLDLIWNRHGLRGLHWNWWDLELHRFTDGYILNCRSRSSLHGLNVHFSHFLLLQKWLRLLRYLQFRLLLKLFNVLHFANADVCFLVIALRHIINIMLVTHML